MEQQILENISKHMKDKKIIRISQHEFTKRKLCVISLKNVHDEIIALVDERKVYCLPIL